jgi:hypothetical protein
LDSNWLILLLAAAIALAVWLFAKPPAVFVIRIRRGGPVAIQGTVTKAFLATIAQLCNEQGIQSGEVRGVTRGRRIALWFSKGLPSGFCQRLRNWWALSGWSAKPSRA